ncbi:alpha/beta hydrolase family protein [Kribbella solani]|uniref:alpha/beta hydrolase family protein n=1 Tax=Kribbella solani TaxID=236067 RepID=UPI0029ABFC54|nr:hypothetical protein [Kribbella solani]MDX2968985.1 hypothetical protein [Kribbella solani]
MNDITRRRVLGGALSLAAGFTLQTAPGSAGAAGRGSDRVRIALPAPTGPYAVGTAALHLVDKTRQDPWLTVARPRELMVSLWYPSIGRGRTAPWMTEGALARYRPELTSFLNQPTGPDTGTGPKAAATQPVSLDTVDFPATHARSGGPVAPSLRPRPVILFSPGFAFGREHGTFVAEDLASHGYVVVTISHTYDAAEVEFPGGRVELGRHDLDREPNRAMQIRRDDTRFVLDQLTRFNAGHGLSPRDTRVPAGLRGSLDLRRVGMFGHSLGGATTAQAMANDARIGAGINLDGSFFTDSGPDAGPDRTRQELVRLADRIGTRPFMIMASGGFGPDYFGDLTSVVWHNLRGWHRFLSITGSTHYTYTDLLPLLTGLVRCRVIPEAPQVGVGLDPDHAVTAIRTYIRAFFDLWLHRRPTQLFDGASTRYPEVKFYS